MHETKAHSDIPDNGKIIKEMADIAFSPEEKTADRLRALNLLSGNAFQPLKKRMKR